MKSTLSELEIINWQPRKVVCPAVTVISSAEPAANGWSELQQRVAACTACSLHTGRTQTVFGVGNPRADIMFIGEAPGFHEDKQGEPFVGRAGQLLTAMLKSIGLSRDAVYIANILKCRPPENRDPHVNEVATCTPFLQEQITQINPRLLVAVGRISAHYLLQTKASMESLRQKQLKFAGTNTPLIATYHPAYLLRNPIDKKKAYADLLFIRSTLQALLTQ